MDFWTREVSCYDGDDGGCLCVSVTRRGFGYSAGAAIHLETARLLRGPSLIGCNDDRKDCSRG